MAGLAWRLKWPTTSPSRAGLAAHAETGEGGFHGAGAAALVALRGQPGRWASVGDIESGGGVD
jgi:hypothetical protein